MNTEKSRIVHFRKKKTERSTCDFKLGNSVLDYTDRYSYLGLVLHEHVNYEETLNVLSCAAGRSLGSLCSKFKFMKNMGFSTFTSLYEKCVSPILDYSSEIWGFKRYVKAEQVEQRAMRFFLGVHRFAPILGIQGDMGWVPSNIRWKICILRYWNRLLKMNQNRLTKQVFLWDYNLENNNWSTEVKNVLNTIDMEYIFENMSTCNIVDLKQKLLEIYKTDWKANLLYKPKLRTYRLFKYTFGTEKYVSLNLDRNYRSLLAQFRLGILPLRLETGRIKNEKVHERICLICSDNLVEDENHFLFQCKAYSSERRNLFAKISNSNRDFENLNIDEKLVYLFQNRPYILAKFVNQCLSKRREFLYK